MDIIKFFRKPYFAVFLATLTLITSCSQYDNDLTESNKLNANDLERIHFDIKSNLINIKISSKTGGETNKTIEEEEAERIYLENVEYLNNHGLEELFIKCNINTDLILTLDYYSTNENSKNIYQELIDKFQIKDEKDASILFTIIEVKQIVERELANSSNRTVSNIEMQRISWGCALAIASTVGVTLGVLFTGPITGGASLVGFLVYKGLATAALIEACGDGWGDI